jgi:outer membrane protein TolC
MPPLPTVLSRWRAALAAPLLAVLAAAAPAAELAPSPAPDLSVWWQQFDDPALPALVAAAQAVSFCDRAVASR